MTVIDIRNDDVPWRPDPADAPADVIVAAPLLLIGTDDAAACADAACLPAEPTW